jgi:hypothetical protein
VVSKHQRSPTSLRSWCRLIDRNTVGQTEVSVRLSLGLKSCSPECGCQSVVRCYFEGGVVYGECRASALLATKGGRAKQGMTWTRWTLLSACTDTEDMVSNVFLPSLFLRRLHVRSVLIERSLSFPASISLSLWSLPLIRPILYVGRSSGGSDLVRIASSLGIECNRSPSFAAFNHVNTTSRVRQELPT